MKITPMAAIAVGAAVTLLTAGCGGGSSSSSSSSPATSWRRVTPSLKGATAALGSSVVGGTPAPASVGSDSVVVAGTSPDGSKAVTVLLFTQGPAFVTLQFDSAAEDPVPPEFVLDVAGKQDQKITAGLEG